MNKLEFFRASPREYAVIFTANATHALKLVGESYPFRPGGQFLFCLIIIILLLASESLRGEKELPPRLHC